MLSKTILSFVTALFVTAILAVSPAVAHEHEKAPRILMGEMYFAVPGDEREAFPPGERQPESILTLTGAGSGEVILAFVNVGELMHQIRSPLFMAAKEVKVEIEAPDGEIVAELVGTDILQINVPAGYSAVFHIQLAGGAVNSFKKDPNLALEYEISCHALGHYEAGMRALVTLVGA